MTGAHLYRFSRDLAALGKPHLTLLAALTALGGRWLAGPVCSRAALPLVSVGLLVASANALNMVMERELDRVMPRTAGRPLAQRRLSPGLALVVALGVAALALGGLLLSANGLTALLGALALAVYLLLYTPLKRRTPWAVGIGALAGAMPPLLGWTSATGSLGWPGITLAVITAVWQVPHFLAIALYRREEYARAGFRTMPVVHGARATQRCILAFALLLVPASLGLHVMGSAGWLCPGLAGPTALLLCGSAWLALGRRDAVRSGRQFFRLSLVYVPALLLGLVLDGTPRLSRAAPPAPRQLEGVTVKERLGHTVELDEPLTNSEGRPVTLRRYFDGKHPVILTLNYYECPMLCTMQLNELTKGLKGLKWTPGREFRLVTLSIDPRDTAAVAQGKRENHLRSLGRRGADWSFLVGKEQRIRRVASSVGFGYRFLPKEGQFAHPAVIMFLSPRGKVSRYIYGLQYRPRDLKFALMEASQGRIGSTVDRLILSCYHYDSSVGRYSPFAWGIVRLASAVTLALLVGLLVVLWRHEVRRRRAPPADPPARQRPS